MKVVKHEGKPRIDRKTTRKVIEVTETITNGVVTAAETKEYPEPGNQVTWTFGELPSYDLTGLTEKQMQALRFILAGIGGTINSDALNEIAAELTAAGFSHTGEAKNHPYWGNIYSVWPSTTKCNCAITKGYR